MSTVLNVTISDGFAPDQRPQAVALFWQAFRAKLDPIMAPEDKALRFLNRVVDPQHAIGATLPDGRLVGLAGFKTHHGSFIGGELADLRAVYGPLSGTVRGLVLSFLERPLQADTLLMDGIFVSDTMRGQGVGSALLLAIKDKAEALGCSHVRLDVIDSNPRARSLYERQGFVAGGTVALGPLRHVFGFRASTTMVWAVGSDQER